VIHEVDDALRTLIDRDAVPRNGVEVSFEAPTKEWAAKRNVPTLNVYLYDIREDLERRDIAYERVVGDDGRVTDRLPPPRRFALSYLITAWTQRAEDEHRLLSAVLSTFLRHDAIPTDVLTGSLAEQPRKILVEVALPPPEDRSISDLWTALGGELKPSLDLVITAPFDTARGSPVAFVVTEEPRVALTPRPTSPSPAGRGPRRPRAGRSA
jgi:Pvc16 N-terminal domain